jgi:hypothetical protein
MARPLLVLAASLAVGCLLGSDVEPKAALVILALAALLLGLAGASPRGRGARWAVVGASLGLGAAGAAAESGPTTRARSGGGSKSAATTRRRSGSRAAPRPTASISVTRCGSGWTSSG